MQLLWVDGDDDQLDTTYRLRSDRKKQISKQVGGGVVEGDLRESGNLERSSAETLQKARDKPSGIITNIYMGRRDQQNVIPT